MKVKRRLKTNHLGMRISNELKAKLERVAKREEKTVSAFVIESILKNIEMLELQAIMRRKRAEAAYDTEDFTELK